MDEGALLDPDVDEGAEIDHILHLAGYLHALFQVLEGKHALGKNGRRQVFARIAVRLLQFHDDVVERRIAHSILLFQRLASLAIRIGSRLDRLQDFRSQGVVLGMHPGIVQLVRALGNLEEARALLESLLAHPGNLREHVARRDRPLFLPELDHLLREARIDARHVLQKRMARRIEVDAHLVDDRTHHLVEAFGELFLVDIVLVEPDADALRIDLHELRKRILEAAPDRNGPPDRQVEFGELLPGKVRGRIDGGAVLVHSGEDALEPVLLDRRGDDCLNFVARRAVSDSHDLDAVLLHRRGDRLFGLFGLRLLVDEEIVEELARLVEGGALGARADARVHPQHPAALERRLHEEVLEVLGKHVDRVGFGVVARFRSDFSDDRRRQQSPEPVLDGVGMIFVVEKDLVLEDRCSPFGIDRDGHFEGALPLGTVHGKEPVALEARKRLGVVPVHLVGRLFAGSLVAHTLCHEVPGLQVPGFDRGAHLHVLGKALGDDVLRSCDRIGCAGDGEFGLFRVLAHEPGRRGIHCSLVLAQHDLSKRRKPAFLGQHASCLLLLFVGSPEVVQLRERGGLCDVRVEGFIQLSERGDPLDHLDAPLFQVFQAVELVDAVADLHFVQASRPLLPVTADERHRAAFRGEADDG